MMPKNRRLFDLATRNAQRQALNSFIARHPEFQQFITWADTIFYPQLSDHMRPVIHRAIFLHDDHSALVPEDAMTFKTSSQEQAEAKLTTWLNGLLPGRYIVVIGDGNGVSFDGQPSWVSESPGVRVTLPAQLTFLLGLAAISHAQCSIRALERDAAVISEAVSGWLPDEPSADEIVYEMTCWSTGTQPDSD